MSERKNFDYVRKPLEAGEWIRPGKNPIRDNLTEYIESQRRILRGSQVGILGRESYDSNIRAREELKLASDELSFWNETYSQWGNAKSSPSEMAESQEKQERGFVITSPIRIAFGVNNRKRQKRRTRISNLPECSPESSAKEVKPQTFDLTRIQMQDTDKPNSLEPKDKTERYLQRVQRKLSKRSSKKGEALLVMLDHLRKTGGSSHLLETDYIRPSSHVRQDETITVGLRRFKVRTLKPDGIPENPLTGADLARLRITYVLIPDDCKVVIVGIFDDRDKYN